MTRGEAKKLIFREWQSFLEDYIDYGEISEAYKMAIEALEQEPCEDAISKESAINILDAMVKEFNESGDFDKAQGIAWVRLQRLPSVQPKARVGHWILCNPLQTDDGAAYVCSVCKTGDWHIDGTEKYCSYCGAKMEERDDQRRNN